MVKGQSMEHLDTDEIKANLEGVYDEVQRKIEETEEITEKSHWGVVAVHVGIAIDELDIIEHGCKAFDEEDLYDYGDFC